MKCLDELKWDVWVELGWVMKKRPEVSEADPQRNKSNTNFWSVQNKSWKYIKYSNIQTSVIYGWKAYTICENNVYLRIAEPQTSATATASLW